MSASLPAAEVAAVLRQVLAGELRLVCYGSGDTLPAPEPVAGDLPRATWDEVWAGDCAFRTGDWWLVFFNDCDCLDYLDSALAPDSRRATYDDWAQAEKDEDGWSIGANPTWLLGSENCKALERLLKAAPVVVAKESA